MAWRGSFLRSDRRKPRQHPVRLGKRRDRRAPGLDPGRPRPNDCQLCADLRGEHEVRNRRRGVHLSACPEHAPRADDGVGGRQGARPRQRLAWRAPSGGTADRRVGRRFGDGGRMDRRRVAAGGCLHACSSARGTVADVRTDVARPARWGSSTANPIRLAARFRDDLGGSLAGSGRRQRPLHLPALFLPEPAGTRHPE